MKPTKSNIPRAFPKKAKIKVVDNSGAKVIELIGVLGYGGRKARVPAAGVADVIVASVKVGDPKIRHKIVYGVIIRQKKNIKRADGTNVKFADNAAILIKDKNVYEARGTIIKGPVAREVITRFPALGKVSKIVI